MVRDGYPFVGYSALVALISALCGYLIDLSLLYYIAGLFLLFSLFCAWFFRDPSRKAEAGEHDILSPGDGRIVSIVEEEENGFFKAKVNRISVFLSVFNVHVNRIPADGTVEYLKYRPGKFMAAFKEGASTENEQSEIGIVNGSRKVMFKQIAGLIARRIIFRVMENQVVKRGERCGLIRFGSRVDIFLPLDAEILVKKGQNVKGGETIIGRFSNET